MDNQRYDILLDYKGYMIDKNSYRESPAPLFGTRFATGRLAYSDLDFWQTNGQQEFSDGFGQLYLERPSEYAFGVGLDITIPRELKLERVLEKLEGVSVGSSIRVAKQLSDGIHIATENGDIYLWDGSSLTSLGTGFTGITDFYEMRGNQYACRGTSKLLKRNKKEGNYQETNITFLEIEFEDDFETGNLNKWDSKEGWQVQGSVVYEGQYAAKASGAPYYLKKKIALSNKGSFEGYFRFGETNKWHYPFFPLSSDNVSLYFIVAANDGHFKYYDGSYKNFPTDKTYTADTWYKIKVSWDGTSHKFQVWIDDVEITGGGITSIIFSAIKEIRILNTNSSGTGTMYVDSVVIKGESTGLSFLEVDAGDLGYGFFDKGLKRTDDGENFLPETGFLYALPESEGQIIKAAKTYNQIFFATSRSLFSLLSGGLGVKIADFSSESSINNFKSDRFSSFLIFSVENLGIFFVSGYNIYPTNIHKLNPFFKFTSCKGIATRGTDIFALVKNETDWYLARCNMDYKKFPMQWSLVQKLSFTPSYIFAYLDNLYVVDTNGQFYKRNENKYISSGYLITSRFDAGMRKVNKLVKSIESFQEDFPQGTKIKLRYYRPSKELSPLYEKEFSPGEDTRFDLENPVKDTSFQIGIVLESEDGSNTPLVSDLTWTYILESSKTGKKEFHFTILGTIAEKKDGSVYDSETSETLTESTSFRYEGKELREIWQELFNAAASQKALNFVGFRNVNLPGIKLAYFGSGRCKVSIDRTNLSIKINMNGTEKTISTEDRTLEQLCNLIALETGNRVSARVSNSAYKNRSAEDLVPVLGVEISTNEREFYLGTDVHSVMFRSNYPRLTYLPDTGFINVVLIEV